MEKLALPARESEPILSVVIVNWNTRDLVLQALASIYKTTEGISKEVVVVDNASTDGSSDAIQSAYPHVILVKNEKNLGFAAANNRALRQIQGRHFLLLNTDVILESHAVTALLEFMDRTPDAAFAGAQLVNPDGTKQNSFDNFPTLLTEGFNKSLLRILFPARFPSKRIDILSPFEVESIIGACTMGRRQVIEEVGFLDDGYFFFLEETDWCYRARQRGWKVYLVPQARAVHLQGATVSRVKAQAKIEYYHSRYLFFRKHRGTFQVSTLRGILFLKLVLNLVMCSFHCLFTFFQARRARERLAITWGLFVWHLRFCPGGGGLSD